VFVAELAISILMILQIFKNVYCAVRITETFIKASIHDRRCAPERGGTRRGRRRLHPRRFCRDAHTFCQVYTASGEEVSGLRDGGVSGEVEGSTRDKHQSARRHDSQFRQAVPEGKDTQSHLHAQRHQDAIRLCASRNIANRVRRRRWTHREHSRHDISLLNYRTRLGTSLLISNTISLSLLNSLKTFLKKTIKFSFRQRCERHPAYKI